MGDQIEISIPEQQQVVSPHCSVCRGAKQVQAAGAPPTPCGACFGTGRTARSIRPVPVRYPLEDLPEIEAGQFAAAIDRWNSDNPDGLQLIACDAAGEDFETRNPVAENPAWVEFSWDQMMLLVQGVQLVENIPAKAEMVQLAGNKMPKKDNYSTKSEIKCLKRDFSGKKIESGEKSPCEPARMVQKASQENIDERPERKHINSGDPGDAGIPVPGRHDGGGTPRRSEDRGAVPGGAPCPDGGAQKSDTVPKSDFLTAPPADGRVTGAIMKSLAERFLKGGRIPLRQFVEQAWPIIEPATTFKANYHIDAICEYLEAVTDRDFRKLIINIPPRYGKSIVVSVFWPAWTWTFQPWHRFMFASYSGSLSTKHSVDRRRLMEDKWYRERWGHVFTFARDQNLKTEYENSKRGHMIATSFGGTASGKGGHTLVTDDPISPEQAESKPHRDAAHRFWDKTWTGRLDDKKAGAMVVVEHRLHPQDMTGHLKSQGGGSWKILELQAKADKRTTIILPKSKRTIVREPGAILWPEREGEKELLDQRQAMGERAYLAQYQQRPTVAAGNIFKRIWWGRYKKSEIPGSKLRIWYWDTASKKKEHNDFWVGLLFRLTDEGIYIERRYKRKMTYPEGRKTVLECWGGHMADALLIEDKSSGQELLNDLKESEDTSRLPIIASKPAGDKVSRANAVSPSVEAGTVYLPEGSADAQWVEDFIETLAAFPGAAHDDDVDAFSGGMLYLRGKSGGPSVGTTYNPEEARQRAGMGKFGIGGIFGRRRWGR